MHRDVSSSAAQQLDCLFLQLAGDLTDCRLRLANDAAVELVPHEILLLRAFEQINLAGVVVVYEAPATGMHELASLGGCCVALSTRRHTLHLNLARRQQVDTRISLIANRNLTLARADVDAGEFLEILEERLVRRSHRQLQLRVLRQDTEVSGLHRHRFLESCSRQHIYYKPLSF